MSWPRLNSEQTSELTAAEAGEVFFVRSDLAVARATGKHRGRFLRGLLTARVDEEAAGDAHRTCLCTAQGRILAIAELRVQRDCIALITAADRVEALIAGLLKFRVAERVQLVVDPAATVLQAPDDRIELPDDPARMMAAWRADGARRGSAAVGDALRILRGVPRLGLDIDDGSTPLEAGLWDAVAFDKGCYLGQEAIAMMAYRGRIRRHLCHLEAAADPPPGPGWTLHTEAGRRAGTVGSGFVTGGRGRGLAMVQRHAFSPGTVLRALPPDGAETVTVRVLDTTVPGGFERAPSGGRP